MSKLRLEGKVALITGGASGIGEETARQFINHGAKVVIADIQDTLGQNLITSITTTNPNAPITYHHCDVRDESQVESTIQQTVQTYGTLDILFSNAGILSSISSILDLDLTSLDNTFSVNVRGVAATIKHGAKVMVEKKIKGSIICTASVAACIGGGGPHGYTASKHAVLGLVKAACSELGAYGIRVNSVSPFGIATPLTCEAYGMDGEMIESEMSKLGNLKGVVLKKRDVAEAVVFLGSDESVYISGHNLVVDGGFTVVTNNSNFST